MSGCVVVETLPLFEPAAGAETLDELITAVWESLSDHRTVQCPVCHGEMRPEYGVHARAVGGRCSACGSIVR